ncbi:DUF4190 domain-containing protein [Catellatospora bangladeshensis]|uniref:Septum formation-related domain-containing protein n=1 Tax=Catellatospora bangladeshensis TaxID=310355 RepID=A0A8J3NNP5_9ACTN|nr:DUF4190 domain-containing protein [Catellatospora bangladeshensis]GIF85070.1 hypothetical protein Cba03nite_64190 [Catellatospora bangladeshensis]
MTYPSPDQNPQPYQDPLAPPPVTPSYPSADPYAQPASPYAAPADPYAPVPPQPPYGATPPATPYGAPQSSPPYSAPQSVPPSYGAPQSVPPSYGAPQSVPPVYGAPQSTPPYHTPPAGYGVPFQQPPGAGGTNGFAIASLVLGILGGILLSVIFGIVALSQIKKRNQTGRGMAIAGLVISGLWLAGICTAVGLAIAFDDTPSSGSPTTTGDDTSVHSLQIGDCLNALEDDEEIESLPVVACSAPHDGEVYAEFRLTGSTYPGLDAIQKEAEERCGTLLESYAPEAADDASVDTYFLYPTDESWRLKSDRLVTCVASFDPPRTGSI